MIKLPAKQKNLSRLDKVLLIAFVFWMGAGLVITPLGVDENTVMGWDNLPAWLRSSWPGAWPGAASSKSSSPRSSPT